MKVLALDIETYSRVDITKCGVYKYTEEDFEAEVERWKPDYSGFMGALIATDRLYPGTIDRMYSDGRLFNLFN